MNYLVGSSVRICAEIEEKYVETTTISLESLIDPDGNEILSTESMEFDSEITNEAFMNWKSTKGVDPVGRYKYILKATNGTYENFEEGYFYLEAR